MDRTFLEGVTDKYTGQPIFKKFPWCVCKVSGVMCSVSACEHYWSIEGWIHSKRRNTLSQELVERLLRTHTDLVLRGSFNSSLHHLLPWDIETVMCPNRNLEVYEKVSLCIILYSSYFNLLGMCPLLAHRFAVYRVVSRSPHRNWFFRRMSSRVATPDRVLRPVSFFFKFPLSFF